MASTSTFSITKMIVASGLATATLAVGAGFAAAAYHDSTADDRAAAAAAAERATYEQAVSDLAAVDLEYQANAASGNEVSAHRIFSAGGMVYTDVDNSGSVTEGDMYVSNGVLLVVGAPGTAGDIQ